MPTASAPTIAKPLPDNIVVRLELDPELPPILGDRGQLVIVFGNLIRNARDAMPDGGQLSISADVNAVQIGITVAESTPKTSIEYWSHCIPPSRAASASAWRLREPLLKSTPDG
jgi:C4-dicarboxylate-specific signal transduction histidine kinase